MPLMQIILGLFQDRKKILRLSGVGTEPLQRLYAGPLFPNEIFALGEVLFQHLELTREPLGVHAGQSTTDFRHRPCR